MRSQPAKGSATLLGKRPCSLLASGVRHGTAVHPLCALQCRPQMCSIDTLAPSQNFLGGQYVTDGVRATLLARVREDPAQPWSTGHNWSFRCACHLLTRASLHLGMSAMCDLIPRSAWRCCIMQRSAGGVLSS